MAEKNRVRRCIKALFPVRRCFTLVRPVAEEQLLCEAHTLRLEHLRPQFQVEVQLLAQAVCTGATPPCVNGAPLTGPLLASLCEAHVAAMNGGAVHAVGGWHLIVPEEVCERAGEKALRLFETILGQPTREKVYGLHELHKSAAKEALDCFKEETRNVPEGVAAPTEGRLRRRIQHAYDLFWAEVMAKVAGHTQAASDTQGARPGGGQEHRVLVENALVGARVGAKVGALTALPVEVVYRGGGALFGGVLGLGVGLLKHVERAIHCLGL